SAIDTLHAIINREPRPAVEVNPRLPAEVSDILGKALAKDLNERYQHAGDFELDLRRLKRAIESNALVSLHIKHALKPQAWWPSRRAMLVWGIVGVLLLVGSLMAAWILGRAIALPNPEASVAPMALTPLTVDPGYDGEPTFSKD